MSYLWLRGNVYWFRMRCPKKYTSVHEKQYINQSLNTDSRSLAQTLAHQVRLEWINELEARALQGFSPGSEKAYKATISLAASNDIVPQTASELAQGPLNDLIKRIEKLVQLDPNGVSARFAADLGGFELPETTLLQVAGRMPDLCTDKVINKNYRQARNWHNRYKRAAETFSTTIGDRALKDISDDDAHDYRRVWEDRVKQRDVTTEYANKHFGYIRSMIDAYYGELEVNKYPNPFNGLKLAGKASWEKTKDQSSKPEFTPNWILSTIISGDALCHLNSQARDILTICAETGCRQTEIFDLPASAIKLDAVVPHISVKIEEGGEHKREIKNQSSRRSVPLVGAALQAMQRNPLGFDRYRGKEGFSDTVMKFFKENSLLPSPEHKISGLRHSFESRMRRAGVSNEDRGYMMGHSMKKIRGREVYGDETSLKIRALFAEMISFPTPYWKPRRPTEIFQIVDDLLIEEGFRVKD